MKIELRNPHLGRLYWCAHSAPQFVHRVYPEGMAGTEPMARLGESGIHEEICRIGRKVHECGFVAGCDGNISVRTGRNTVLATPTAICKGLMEPDDLVTVDMEGRQTSGHRHPSIELG